MFCNICQTSMFAKHQDLLYRLVELEFAVPIVKLHIPFHEFVVFNKQIHEQTLFHVMFSFKITFFYVKFMFLELV